MATYTNFCCRSGGSNLNAGTLTGDTTEPGTSASYTYASGNWDGTSVFTVASGNPQSAGVAVGQFASVYADGSTVTGYVGRVTAVSSTTITVSTTAKSGTAPTSGTGNRTLKIGGAWQGPNGSSGFPLTVLSSSMTNAAGDSVRLNLKNDQTYSVTANIAILTVPTVQGYASSYGDGGRATIDGGTTGASYIVITNNLSGGAIRYADLICKNNGSTGSANWMSGNVGSLLVERCVFTGSCGNGLASTTGSATIRECEFYANNKNNTSNTGGLLVQGAAACVRCVFHDNAGSNSFGARHSSAGNEVSFHDCVFDTNGGVGLSLGNSTGNSLVTGCDFYNNGSHGVLVTGRGHAIESCNFVKNAGYGVAIANTSAYATIQNCGYGSGTQANTSGTVQTAGQVEESGAVTYDADLTPWTDPANGDFTIRLAAAKNAGRGTFLQTASSYTGTVGYPVIGAAQALASLVLVKLLSLMKVG